MKPLGSSRKQLSCDRITLIGEQHIEPDNRMAYLLDREIYQETEDIALGKIKKTPLLSELSDWFTSMYSVKILNIQFDELKGSNTNRYGLHVIIQNTEDYQKMYDRLGDRPNEEYQRQIGLEFKRIALRYNFVDKTKLDDLFVIYNDFSREAKTMANRRAAKEVRTY